MPNLVLLFNHTLTQEQEDDAVKSLGLGKIIYMPDDVRNIWGQIPADLLDIGEYLEPVRHWLAETANGGDYVLIQGDFGATYLLVNYAKELQLKTLYATTKREVVEKQQGDGSVKMEHVFKHILFRRYSYNS